LQWSRWFRCDSPHSLLVVPSGPGIFAIAEEITTLASETNREGHDFSRADSAADGKSTSAAEGAFGTSAKRMLGVLQFAEDDDMAYTLDRMFTRENPMRARLASGRCFLRFVVIQDPAQRRSICGALNQWMLTSAERASGLPGDFLSSLELTTQRVEQSLEGVERPLPASIMNAGKSSDSDRAVAAKVPPAHLDSGANANLHCPHPLPSGF
jgi:hypothetical protein